MTRPSQAPSVSPSASSAPPASSHPRSASRSSVEPGSVRFAAKTDVGRKRDHNEDNFLVDQRLKLYVVCDGMGGHAAGEVASAVAVRTVSEEVRRSQDLLQHYLAQSSGADHVSKKDILNMLTFAVNTASRKIHAEALQDPDKRGMGTTLVAVLLLGQQAFIIHVGDSRIYLLRNDALEQLTEDHNVYNEFIKKKKLAEAAKNAPRDAITRAVGVYEHCEPETLVIDVAPGDRFLLCTDGLSGYFEAPMGSMAELAKKLIDADPDRIVTDLVSTANGRGGRDNITAVLVSLGELDSKDEERLRKLEAQRHTLAKSALFRQLNPRELRRVLQITELSEFAAGQTIVQEGQNGEEMYVVLTGAIEVQRGGSAVAHLQPGEHFGEMALIRDQPRSASAVASGDTHVMVIHRKDFFEILRTEHRLAVKLLWQLTGVLSDRLAETTRNLGIARDELSSDDITCEVFGLEDDEEFTAEMA